MAPLSQQDHLAGGADGPDDVRRAPGEPLPVLVLTGYLGAGKTTLLNHLLSGAPGLRIAALVNDFGDIDVDAGAVADRVDSMVSLPGGCVCCEVDASELVEALGELADPGLGLDLAVIEASGLAEPAILSRMVHEVPRHLVRHAGMIQVVDAEGLAGTMQRHPSLSTHLAEADLVVVNKCDLVPRERFDALRTLIRSHAPQVAVYPTVRAEVPAGLLLGLDPAESPAGHDDGDQLAVDVTGPAAGGHDDDPAAGGHHHDAGGHTHLHDAYRAVTVTPAGPLHPRRFLAATTTPPTGVYRIKGALSMATADGGRRYEVAMVGRRLELRAAGDPEDEPGMGAGPASASEQGHGAPPDGLVMIGVGLDDDEVSRFLDEAVLDPGETVDSEAELGLHPYLVAEPDASDVEEWIYDEQRSAPVTGSASMLADPEDPDAFDPAFTP